MAWRHLLLHHPLIDVSCLVNLSTSLEPKACYRQSENIVTWREHWIQHWFLSRYLLLHFVFICKLQNMDGWMIDTDKSVNFSQFDLGWFCLNYVCRYITLLQWLYLAYIDRWISKAHSFWGKRLIRLKWLQCKQVICIMCWKTEVDKRGHWWRHRILISCSGDADSHPAIESPHACYLTQTYA